jgi:diguanylate cyclase (GGDEF)-like protein
MNNRHPTASASLWRNQRARLLLVDANSEHIQTFYSIFNRSAHMFLAKRSELALPMCRQQQPDVVLVNVSPMAAFDGLNACEQLKADDAMTAIPILALTDQNDPGRETQALKAGATDCLSLPLNPWLVRARVETQLILKFQSQWLRDWVADSPATDALYRKRFELQFNTEWRRAQRSGQALTLLRVSLDGFQSLTHQRGPLAAEDAMAQLGIQLRKQLKRPADLVCRYGQGQFVCVLPETPWPQSLELTRQVQTYIRDWHMQPTESILPWPLAISIGVATKHPDSQGSMSSLLALADARLHEARQAGGGQVRGVLMP